MLDHANVLPPRIDFDHHIPVEGNANPVNLRPYRYTPAQKDEIEKLVKEMMQNQNVQESHRPCASLVLLVQKKDGGWRFCVDCR